MIVHFATGEIINHGEKRWLLKAKTNPQSSLRIEHFVTGKIINHSEARWLKTKKSAITNKNLAFFDRQKSKSQWITSINN